MAIDEKKLKKRDNDAGVFMVISDKQTGEKMEVNFKDIIAGSGCEKKSTGEGEER